MLFDNDRIRLHNLDGAIVVEVECYDGERITVVTGRDHRHGGNSAAATLS
ncbi:MAG: hypothetical protein M3O55_04335 [Actinomycetota bacterium]|nr:hypothetical protein [Actinomycetota bacterium]